MWKPKNIQRYAADSGRSEGEAIRSGRRPAAPGHAPGFTWSAWNQLGPELSCRPNPNLNSHPVIIFFFFRGKTLHTSHFLVIDCKLSLNGHRHTHTHTHTYAPPAHTHTHKHTHTHEHWYTQCGAACVIMRQSSEALIQTVISSPRSERRVFPPSAAA